MMVVIEGASLEKEGNLNQTETNQDGERKEKKINYNSQGTEESQLKTVEYTKSDGNPKIGSFLNKNDLKITTYEWKVQNPRGIIVLIHGFNSNLRLDYLRHNIKISGNQKEANIVNIDDYYIYRNSWIETMNQANFSVCGIDLQGHGESEGINGSRLDLYKFDDLVDDIIKFLNGISVNIDVSSEQGTFSFHKSATDKRLPIYIMGLSMGGNISLRTLELLNKTGISHNINVKGCIVLAGMISFKEAMNQFRNKYLIFPLLRIIGRIAPTFRVTPKVVFKMYKYMNDIYEKDPNTYNGKATSRFGCELLEAVKNLDNDAENLLEQTSLLFFHAKEDHLCSFEGARNFFEKIKSSYKNFVELRDMEHILTSEPGNEQIIQHILRWLSQLEGN